MIIHKLHKIEVKIIHFFNKTKLIQIDINPEINLLTIQLIIFHQMMKKIIIKIFNDFFSSQRLRSYGIHQPDIFEPYTRDKQIRQPRKNPTSQNKTFQTQNPIHTQSYQPFQMHTNSHYRIFYNNMK